MPQGSVLGPIYIANLSIVLISTTATYANDTAVLVIHNNQIEASLRRKESLHHFQRWLKNRESKLTEQIQYM